MHCGIILHQTQIPQQSWKSNPGPLHYYPKTVQLNEAAGKYLKFEFVSPPPLYFTSFLLIILLSSVISSSILCLYPCLYIIAMPPPLSVACNTISIVYTLHPFSSFSCQIVSLVCQFICQIPWLMITPSFLLFPVLSPLPSYCILFSPNPA